MATRWGIAGAGRISNDFCLSLKHLPASEHEIVAVGASSKDRADQFASEFGISRSYGSYKELGEQEDIDVVYIGTIHIMHVELCLQYIAAGKSVVCEKPMALSLDGCKRVLAAAKEKGVLFIEGTWSRFFPAYKLILDQISSGAIGEVKVVEVNFTIPIMNVPRIKELDLGGGAMMDIGLYAVQAANLIFKGKPLKVVSEASLDDTGVDKTASVTLKYDNGRFASLVFSTETQGGNNHFFIRGTKGTLQIPDTFWCPDRVILPDGEVRKCPLPDVPNAEKYNFPNSQGFCYEAQEVRRCLLQGLKESPLYPHEDIECVMYVCQEFLDQHGIKYKFP